MTPALRLILRQILLVTTVALAVFALMKASPVDPVEAYLGPALSRLSAEQVAQIAAARGLDQPWHLQFAAWGRALLQGDPGFSITYNAPVTEVLRERLLPSLVLTGGAWLLSGLLGFGLGIWAAFQRGGWTDRLIRSWCYLLAGTPTFWLAMLLVMVFSVGLGWAPVCCAGPVGLPPEQVSTGQRLQHLALPLLALTLFGVAQIALHSRLRMIAVLNSDYVLLARAQGARGLDIALSHGLRNAGLPALVLMFAGIGELIGGAMLAEQVFAWPGLGRATVEAGLQGDVPLLLAIAMLTVVLVSSANLLADLLARHLAPQMAAGGRSEL